MTNAFLIAKLTFYKFLAVELAPFLTEYQSDGPKTTLLYEDLLKFFQDVMRIVIKPGFIEKIQKKYSKMNFDTNDIYSTANKLKIGYATKQVLVGMKNNDNDITGLTKLQLKNQDFHRQTR